MDIKGLIDSLKTCPCGRRHFVEIKAVEIGRGLTQKCGEILAQNGFPRRILVVADTNSLSASNGVVDVLKSANFDLKLKVFDSFRHPTQENVAIIEGLTHDVDGILSIGTGSINDVCRRAALTMDKEFAILATAPSMDGFASGTAPIIENGMKDTLPAQQPSVIIADTDVLAASPTHLKAAGFGDVIGKFIALVDWRVANLLVNEYYCENIANLVRDALARMISIADKVIKNDAETAGFVMESLVLTGIAMRLAECSRPASGAEHQISHYVGMKQLADGITSDYHGKKVGVATLALVKAYNKLSKIIPQFCQDKAKIEEVIACYGERQRDFITSQNKPSIVEQFSVQKLEELWPEIQKIIAEELPSYEFLTDVMKSAGAATTFEEIGVDKDLKNEALTVHSFMRRKVVLTRLLFLTDQNVTKLVND